jgi:hypothetical protein
MAIELREITSYPALEEEEKKPLEPTPAPMRREQTQNLSLLPSPPSPTRPVSVQSAQTPIVPITAPPPALCFVEQQRLKEEAKKRASDSAPLNVPENTVRQSVQSPMNTPGFGFVRCCGCGGIIQYPLHVLIVFCTACRASTATRPLVNVACRFCGHSSYHPTDCTVARCRCGVMYSIRPA